jgi:predicted Zn-dependent protease
MWCAAIGCRSIRNVVRPEASLLMPLPPLSSVCRALFRGSLSAACVAALLSGTAFSADKNEHTQPVPVSAGDPAAPPASRVDKPIRVPDGASHEGWEAYLKNDFAAAEKSFRAVIEKDPKDLFALEGLRATLVAQGDYKAVQDLNLQMVKAAPENILASIFATRAIDTLQYVESRAAILPAFNEAAANASSPVLSVLKDHIATLQMRAEKPEEAKKTLAGLGYLDRWQFVAGPFGRKDKNDADLRGQNLMARRFAPERDLHNLEFTDESGEKVDVYKDVPARQRELNLDALYHGANGIFYAFTNLESDVDQEVMIGVGASSPYRVYLRGEPIVLEPGDEQYHRASGELVKVKLLKGPNPLLVKVSNTRSLIVRLFSADFGLPKDVRVTPLDAKGLSQHRVATLRGFRLSEKMMGAAAEYFLKRGKVEEGKIKSLKSLAENGELNVAEAYWLDMALQRENDHPARLALARTLAGSYPDSVGVLDVSATILNATGHATGDTEAREIEEAKVLRTHALSVLPTSHQHLLQMYYFFSDHELKEQAFNQIKACVQAHPQSPAALAALAQAYEAKQFYVEAEQNYEKAAALDNAYLPRLAWFHEFSGNRARARELYAKQVELLQVDKDAQFETALRRGELETASTLLAELEKNYPERATDLQQNRLRLLLEQGKLDDAFAFQKKMYEAQKEYDPNRRGNLQSLVDLALRLSKDDEAKSLLKGFLKENPGDFDFQRRLRDLEGDNQARWWEAYDVKVPQIDTSKFTAANYPTANHAWIVDFMVTKILPDLSRESYVHIAQKVLNTEGINELSELLVRAQRQDIVFIRTLNPDGSAFQPQNVHNFNLAQTASLYKVGPGSILEHAYVDRNAADKEDPSLTMGFNFNAIDAPRAVSRWVVMIPDELKDKLEIRKIRPEMVSEKILQGPPGYTVYEWSNKQVEGIKYEPFMPGEGDQEVIPLVTIDTPNRPFHANRWLMRRPLDFIPPEAVAQAKQLVAPLAPGVPGAGALETEEMQFARVLDWVRNTIQPGAESHTLDDVWFSRAGSATQMMVLAREMCRSAGLNVFSAFVNGSYAPGRVWRSKNARRQWEPAELANFGSSGQMLVLEPRNGADTWAQFIGHAPKFYNAFDTNQNQLGAFALVLDHGVARIKRVRGETATLTTATQRVEVTLDAQGSGTINGLIQFFGQMGGSVREMLSDPRRGPQIKEQVVRSAWRNLQIGKVQISGENRDDLPLGFAYNGTVRSLASNSGSSYFLAPFLGRPRILELRGPAERTSDLLLKSEVADLDQTFTYVAPEGHAWVEVPDNLFLCTEFGFYVVSFSVNGRTLTCSRSYLMPAQRVTPENYAKMLDFLTQVNASAQQRIAYAAFDKDLPGAPVAVTSTEYSSFGGDTK